MSTYQKLQLDLHQDAAMHAELRALAAEAMGWQPLSEGVYLHHGNATTEEGEENVIHVVGVPDASMAELNVLLQT